MRRRAANAGFTAAEMLVATMIGAVVVGSAAMALGTLTRGQRQLTNAVTIKLTSGAQNNFYGVDSNTIVVSTTDNGTAQSRRDQCSGGADPRGRISQDFRRT